jgi:hypothetical protein
VISSLNIRNYGLISESECESVFHRFEQQNLTAEGLSSPLTPNFHYICGVDSMVSGMIPKYSTVIFINETAREQGVLLTENLKTIKENLHVAPNLILEEDYSAFSQSIISFKANTNMRRCIIFIITLFVCFEGYSQNIIAGEEKIDYSGIDKMFSDMIKSENLLRLKCVSKDISWEYYRGKTGQEISKLGDVGYYFKHIKRYYNSKYMCLIHLETFDEEIFDHQYIQHMYYI